MAVPPSIRGKPRPALWSPEALKEKLRQKDTSLRQILIGFSTPEIGWRGLYGDVSGWRQTDKELDQLINDTTAEVSKRGGDHGGRPRNDEDPEHADWKIKFCEAYAGLRSRNQAAAVTPYKPAEIAKFLSPRFKEYDPNFAEMVHAVEMQLAGRAEELVWKSLEDASSQSSPKDVAWIGINVLKNLPNSGWGNQRVDLNISGTVVNRFEIDRKQLIAEIVADQQDHFERNRKQIGSGNVIEAEVVE